MQPTPMIDPWRIELIVVRDGSHSGGERRSLSREVERGLLTRLRAGAYVERVGFESLSLEGRHLVRMRAFAAVSARPVVFSHWSAAVVHRLPVLADRLSSVHTTVTVPSDRGRRGVTAHVLPLHAGEVRSFDGLLVTSAARTAIDVAGAAPLEEGVMAVDAALRHGLPRELLEAAVDLAGPRRAATRIHEAVAMGHPGAGSAAESRSRVTIMRLGVAPPELQHRIVLRGGREAFLDMYFREADAGGEVDGIVKYLDPRLARQGAGRAVYDEKVRQEEVLEHVSAVARWGWAHSASTAMLRPVLARVRVVAGVPGATIADYARAAQAASRAFVAGRPPRPGSTREERVSTGRPGPG